MPKWMDAAWAEMGQCEVSGSDANPAIIGYFKSVGREDIVSDEVAWCAAFVGACLNRGGISIAAIPPSERLLANSYLKIGRELAKDDLRVGAIAVLSRGSNPAYGHTGFIVGSTETEVILLNGNSGNKVCTTHFPRSRIRGVRWPETVTAQAVTATSRIAKAATKNVKDTAKAATTQIVPAPPDPTPVAHAAANMPAPDAIVAKASGWQSAIETGISFCGFVSHKWPWIMAAVGLYFVARIAWNSSLIKKWRHQDAATGKTPIASDAAPTAMEVAS